jgi:uncharacterized glyoxalase superfamily protein PhnB
MRFMVMIKSTANSEAGIMPSERLLTEMGQFNEALVKAGVMVSGEGLQPSSKGARVRFSGREHVVVDGPFAETKELIAGFWIWQVKSKEEAIEWVKRCPNPMDQDCEIELRQVFEAEDFGAEFTPELRAQEERLRAQLAAAKVEPVPESQGAIPYLVIRGAAEAIGFYERVFGASVVFRLDAPDGRPMHAELKIGPARFMLTEERPEYQALSPLSVGGTGSSVIAYVPDADTAMARALSEGSTQGMAVADQFWGDRSGSFTDPYGHQWMVSTHIEDPSDEQVRQRAQAMFEGGAKPC